MNPLSTRRTSLGLGLVAASLLATALATPSVAATAEAPSSAGRRTPGWSGRSRACCGTTRAPSASRRTARGLAPGVEMSVVPSTRAAADGTGDCRTGYACVWQHRDATGYRLDFYDYGSYTLSSYRMPDGTSWQDQVSSYYNAQTGGAWIVGKNWVTSGGSGQLERIWGGPTYAYEALVHANDQADVVEFYP